MSEPAFAGEEWVPEDSFGLRLIALRKARDWTQKEAAELCGVDDGSWSNWENGSRPRAMDKVVAKISAATGVSRAWLMWGNPLSRWNVHSSDLTCEDDPFQLDFDFTALERRDEIKRRTRELVPSP